MTAVVPLAPCKHCGVYKRIDSWCATDACAKRVAQVQAEQRLIFGAMR